MTIDLTQIILAVITLIGALVVRYLIPLLREKTDEKSFAMLQMAVEIAVYAAEQQFKSDEGQKKKDYVVKLLAEKGYNVDMEEINAMIEASVKALKINLAKE